MECSKFCSDARDSKLSAFLHSAGHNDIRIETFDSIMFIKCNSMRKNLDKWIKISVIFVSVHIYCEYMGLVG
jgi:hypothetical protein